MAAISSKTRKSGLLTNTSVILSIPSLRRLSIQWEIFPIVEIRVIPGAYPRYPKVPKSVQDNLISYLNIRVLPRPKTEPLSGPLTRKQTLNTAATNILNNSIITY
jgi:hypothetical protein